MYLPFGGEVKKRASRDWIDRETIFLNDNLFFYNPEYREAIFLRQGVFFPMGRKPHAGRLEILADALRTSRR